MQPDDFRKIKGCCLACGYLAKWEEGDRLYIFSTDDRFNGRAFYQKLPGDVTVTTMPHCVRGVSFLTEPGLFAEEGQSLAEVEQAAAAALQRLRHCSLWYPYREGLSPQGHLEEQRAFEFEERREAFEQRMEEGRQAFEMDLETGRRNFEAAMADRPEQSEERRHSMMRWVAIVAAFLIVVEIAAVILGASPGSLLGDLLGR